MSTKIPLSLPELRAAYPSLALFVDVSKWQKDIVWAELSKYIDGAIIKATGCLSSGVLHIDGQAARNALNIKAHNKTPGFYHYAKQVIDGGRAAPSGPDQARYFVSKIKQIHDTNNQPFEPAFLCLDLEPGELRDAIDAGWAPADVERFVRGFMDTLQSIAPPGTRCEIYYSGACVGAADGGLDFLAREPKYEGWWAGYPSGGPSAAGFPTKPLGFPDNWQPWGAWQFSSDGSSPGVRGDLDLNVCRPGSQFEKIMKGGRSTPAPSAFLPVLGFVALAGGLTLWRRPSLWRRIKSKLRRLF